MADTADAVPWRPPDWLIQLLRLPWKTRRVIVGNLAISVIAGAIVAWLFFHPNDLKGTPFEWLIQNSWWLLSLWRLARNHFYHQSLVLSGAFESGR